MASHAKSSGKQKNLNKTLPRIPWGIKSDSKPQRRVRDYLVSISKTDLLVGATKTEANQVLGSPLTVSTRRVEPTTSKEEAKTRSHEEEFLKNTLSNSLEHFQERSEQNGLVLLGFSIKVLLQENSSS